MLKCGYLGYICLNKIYNYSECQGFLFTFLKWGYWKKCKLGMWLALYFYWQLLLVENAVLPNAVLRR